MNDKSLTEIEFFQWQQSNLKIINDLKLFGASSWCALDYQNLVDNPAKSIQSMVDFCHIDSQVNANEYKVLAHSRTTISSLDKS